MNMFFTVLLFTSLIMLPFIIVVILSRRKCSKVVIPINDVEMIRFIKQQEMIEGMRYGNKNK